MSTISTKVQNEFLVHMQWYQKCVFICKSMDQNGNERDKSDQEMKETLVFQMIPSVYVSHIYSSVSSTLCHNKLLVSPWLLFMTLTFLQARPKRCRCDNPSRLCRFWQSCADPKQRLSLLTDKAMESAIKYINKKFPNIDFRGNIVSAAGFLF